MGFAAAGLELEEDDAGSCRCSGMQIKQHLRNFSLFVRAWSVRWMNWTTQLRLPPF